MKYFLKKQIHDLISTISSEVIERDIHLKLSILGIFAKESVFLLGLPGVGKSLISRKISSIFSGVKEFSVLMSKFTLTDEIFGPIDINKLREGNFTRKIKNYLPDANIAFLDEIWKASSSIQNTLLTILNEKLFVNDGKVEKVDLYFTIAASNELPERNQSLEALWDRFLIKFYVAPIQNSQKFIEMITNQQNLLQTNKIKDKQKLNFSFVDKVAKEIPDVLVPQEILNFILKLKKEIEIKNTEVLQQNPFADGFDQYYISDRKWKKIVGALQTSAYLNERFEVDISDLNMLPYMLWNNMDQLDYYQKLIEKHIFNFKYNSIYNKQVESLKKLRERLITFTTHKYQKEEIQIQKITNNRGVDYYCFADKNKQIYYFPTSEIDSIPAKARFSMDWLISYVTEEQFVEGLEPTSKLLMRYEDHKFFIYEDNDETKESYEIFTNFKKELKIKYELIKISNSDNNLWSEICLNFVTNINHEIEKIQNQKTTLIKSQNLFWDHATLAADLVLTDQVIAKLETLAEKLKILDAEKDKLKIGFNLSKLDSLYSLNLE